MDGGVLDEVLSLLDGYGPEFGGGFSNHGPMAAEALVALGLAEEAPRWVARYRSQLEPAPVAGEPISLDGWQQRVGDAASYADWEVLFRHQLDDAPWDDVVGKWAARLLPGLAGAATHGVIRTAHAVRMAQVAETRETLAELARGLAYWAASFEALSGNALPSGRLRVEEAVESLPAMPPELAAGFFIDERLRALTEVEAFPEVVDALEAPGDVDEAFSEVTAVFAGAYLANAQRRPIEFVHTVTGPAAVRALLPLLPDTLRSIAFGYAWQVAAGIQTACGEALPVDGADTDGLSWDEAAAAALAGGDEHAIKMVEACRREDRLRPDPRYLAAATDVVGRLGR